jgi:hypothetical protein
MSKQVELEYEENIKTANMDVAGISDRIVAFSAEIILSQSATSNGDIQIRDKERWGTYLDRLDAILDNFNTPPMDLPRTHPDNYTGKGFPSNWEDQVENTTAKDVVRRLQAGHKELTQSASKDQGSGILGYDVERLKALTENARTVISVTEPALDMPEQTTDVIAAPSKK